MSSPRSLSDYYYNFDQESSIPDLIDPAEPNDGDTTGIILAGSFSTSAAHLLRPSPDLHEITNNVGSPWSQRGSSWNLMGWNFNQATSQSWANEPPVPQTFTNDEEYSGNHHDIFDPTLIQSASFPSRVASGAVDLLSTFATPARSNDGPHPVSNTHNILLPVIRHDVTTQIYAPLAFSPQAIRRGADPRQLRVLTWMRSVGTQLSDIQIAVAHLILNSQWWKDQTMEPSLAPDDILIRNRVLSPTDSRFQVFLSAHNPWPCAFSHESLPCKHKHNRHVRALALIRLFFLYRPFVCRGDCRTESPNPCNERFHSEENRSKHVNNSSIVACLICNKKISARNISRHKRRHSNN